jgi:hypothetical protein
MVTEEFGNDVDVSAVLARKLNLYRSNRLAGTRDVLAILTAVVAVAHTLVLMLTFVSDREGDRTLDLSRDRGALIPLSYTASRRCGLERTATFPFCRGALT